MTLREIDNAIAGFRASRNEDLSLARHFIYILSNPHYKKLKVFDILKLETDTEELETKDFTKEDLKVFDKWNKADKTKTWEN